MSAHALLSVVLQKLPVRKTSKAGRPYAMASARDGKGMDAKWWTIFAYSETGIEALEALTVGETFAATGSFDATIWAPEGREPRIESDADRGRDHLGAQAQGEDGGEEPKAEGQRPRARRSIMGRADRGSRTNASR